LTEGKEVIGKLLIELQVRKGAKKFYTELTKPFPCWEGERDQRNKGIGLDKNLPRLRENLSVKTNRVLSETPTSRFLGTSSNDEVVPKETLCWSDREFHREEAADERTMVVDWATCISHISEIPLDWITTGITAS